MSDLVVRRGASGPLHLTVDLVACVKPYGYWQSLCVDDLVVHHEALTIFIFVRYGAYFFVALICDSTLYACIYLQDNPSPTLRMHSPSLLESQPNAAKEPNSSQPSPTLANPRAQHDPTQPFRAQGFNPTSTKRPP
ncbi:hypothetical protein CPB83DRAFT_899310 [Crepidotus variabilis]|uniref:Uncharacterized protein n=1 Tax=Crepidotus variabilis TaxID=179855 RepID=A0A9P6E594_9AGAR|nr:hypothetical protein CPB83DRAFT_899310 [Crepidotus variabilis]